MPFFVAVVFGALFPLLPLLTFGFMCKNVNNTILLTTNNRKQGQQQRLKPLKITINDSKR
jgi:hypothetical protein